MLCPGKDQEPRLLHGDLTPENILLETSGKSEAAVRLIDFGDSGFGDPLFDVIPLFITTLR